MMAAFIPFPEALLIEWIMSQAGQIVENTAIFQAPEELDTIELTDVAGTAIAAWITHMATYLSDQLDLNQVKVTSLSTATSPSVIVPAPVGTDGVISGTCNPLNVAIVISERTDSRGRSYRGRWYQGGIPTSFNADSGSVNAEWQENILNLFVDMIDDIETEHTLVHCVGSRRTAGAARVTGVATPITAYFCNPDFDSRRTRLKGRGA